MRGAIDEARCSGAETSRAALCMYALRGEVKVARSGDQGDRRALRCGSSRCRLRASLLHCDAAAHEVRFSARSVDHVRLCSIHTAANEHELTIYLSTYRRGIDVDDMICPCPDRTTIKGGGSVPHPLLRSGD